MDYIDRLTELRNENDLKQSELSDLLGVKQSAISKYENRRAQYTIDDLIKLCKFYGVSADYILGLPKGLNYPER